MKMLVNASCALITEKDPLILVERMGRLCYKSDSAYTRETAVKFIEMLVDRKHYAMLEHAVFLFKVKGVALYDYIMKQSPFVKGTVRTNTTNTTNLKLISLSLRTILQNENLRRLFSEEVLRVYPELSNILKLPVTKFTGATMITLEEVQNIEYNELLTHANFSVHFVCDRGISHEIVRHRIASFAQESTRYCNYSKDKFGNEVTFIKPLWLDTCSEKSREEFLTALAVLEKTYLSLTDENREDKWQPQQARAILPNALKTEIGVTANFAEWLHIKSLRYSGDTGAPHPQMLEVTKPLFEDLIPKAVEELVKTTNLKLNAFNLNY